MFNSIINGTLSLSSVSICIISAIILGMIISFVYMKTTKYSKNFAITIVMLPLLVGVVMMMVNGNLGTSIAILGAFGLVRFRSIPGTSKEIATVFWTMAVGLAIGMGQIFFAGLITAIIAILVFILSYTKFGESDNKPRILNVAIPEDLDYDEVFDEIFNKYTKKYELIKVNTADLGSIYELRYEVVMNNNVKEKDFIDELRVRNGNLKISMHRQKMEEVL